jgi:phosphoribosylglycinamide formyltransferase 2
LNGKSRKIQYQGVREALTEVDTSLRLFGKPEVQGQRRMGVTLALGSDIDDARRKARRASDIITEQSQLLGA